MVRGLRTPERRSPSGPLSTPRPFSLDVGRKILGGDHQPVAGYQGTLDGVLEFPDVPRPPVGPEEVHGLGEDFDLPSLESGWNSPRNFQANNGISSTRSRKERDLKFEHGNAEEKVFTKTSP